MLAQAQPLLYIQPRMSRNHRRRARRTLFQWFQCRVRTRGSRRCNIRHCGSLRHPLGVALDPGLVDRDAGIGLRDTILFDRVLDGRENALIRDREAVALPVASDEDPWALTLGRIELNFVARSLMTGS